MPGSLYLGADSPAAGYGYGGLGAYPYAPGYGITEGASHGSFVIWLLVFALVSVAVLGGLKVGGFSFVFRTR